MGPTAESTGASAGSAPSSSAAPGAPGSAGEAYPSAAAASCSGSSAPSGSTRGWERSDGRPRVSNSTPVIAGVSAACSWRWRRARGSALIGGSRRGPWRWPAGDPGGHEGPRSAGRWVPPLLHQPVEAGQGPVHQLPAEGLAALEGIAAALRRRSPRQAGQQRPLQGVLRRLSRSR